MEDSITEYKAGDYCKYEEFQKSKKSKKLKADLVKEIIGFANAFGGNLIIGKNDKDGSLEPVDKPKLMIELLSKIIRDRIKPRLLYWKITFDEDSEVITINVRESPEVHSDTKDNAVYYRIGESKERIYGYEVEMLKNHKKRLNPNYWYEVSLALKLLDGLTREERPKTFFSGLIDYCLRCDVLGNEDSLFENDLLEVGKLLENWHNNEYNRYFPEIPEEWINLLTEIKNIKDSEAHKLTNEEIQKKYGHLFEKGEKILKSMGSMFNFYGYEDEFIDNRYKFYEYLPPSYREFRANLLFRMYQLQTWDNRPLDDIPEEKRWGETYKKLLSLTNFYSGSKTTYLGMKPSFAWYRIKDSVEELINSYETQPFESVEDTAPFIHLHYPMKSVIHPYCKHTFQDALRYGSNKKSSSFCHMIHCKYNDKGCKFIKDNSKRNLTKILQVKIKEEQRVISELQGEIALVKDWLKLHTS